MFVKGSYMSDFEDKLKQTQSFLSSLSLKKIALLTTFLFVVGFAYASYDNRDSVYNFFGQLRSYKSPVVRKLSKTTTDQIDAVVSQSELIVGIQITLVDFQRNTRIITYSRIDDPGLNDSYSKFLVHAPMELPLFNDDLINNRRLVELVNGEFICNPYKETIAAALAPESTNYVQTLCANSIPPFYGRFSGIIGVYLKKEPTNLEKDEIRNIAKTLGTVVYQNDLR
jgi:hypothetical protein